MQQYFSVLTEVNQSVSRTPQLPESMNAVLKILLQSDNIKSGTVFLVNTERGILELISSIGHYKSNTGIVIRLGEGITGKVAESGNPAIVPMLSREPLYFDGLAMWNNQKGEELTFFAIPIVQDYQTLGVLK